MNILVVGAHPDDEILGCGATLGILSKERNIIHSLILGEGITARDQIRKTQVKKLRKNGKKANLTIGIDHIEFFNFPDNKFDSVPLLSLVKVVEKKVKDFEPDIIYTHHFSDLNIDHQLTYQAILTACRPQPDFNYPDIISFFIPSSTDWNIPNPCFGFSPNIFVNVKKTIELKLDALRQYESEMKNYPHSRSLESIRTFSKYWGNRVGLEYVEPFVLVRSIRK